MLVTETVAIEVAARSPRVMATSWGPTVQDRRGLSLLGRCSYDKEPKNLCASKDFTSKLSVKYVNLIAFIV